MTTLNFFKGESMNIIFRAFDNGNPPSNLDISGYTKKVELFTPFSNRIVPTVAGINNYSFQIDLTAAQTQSMNEGPFNIVVTLTKGSEVKIGRSIPCELLDPFVGCGPEGLSMDNGQARVDMLIEGGTINFDMFFGTANISIDGISADAFVKKADLSQTLGTATNKAPSEKAVSNALATLPLPDLTPITDSINTLNEAVFVLGDYVPVTDFTWTANSYVSTAGVVTSSQNYKLSSLIAVSQEQKYRVYLRAGVVAAVSGWNNGVFAPALMVVGVDTNNATYYEFTIPAGVTHIRFSCRVELTNPTLEKFEQGEGEPINRIDLIQEQVDLINQKGNNGLIASFADFTGSATITGNNTVTGGLFQYPVPVAIEDLDIFARIKVNTLGTFGLCRTNTTNGTVVAINASTVQVRKLNNTVGTTIYTYTLPFSVEAGKEYIVRVFKQNKDIILSIHGEKQHFVQFVERTDTLDFGRNWGNPAVFCQSGSIQVINVFVRDISFISPVTLILGHSFVEGWGIVNNLMKRYAALMRDYTLGDVFIAGRGGDTTTMLLERFDTEIAKVNSQYVMIDIGLNETNVTTYTNNMQSMIAKTKHAGKIPVLCTVTPRSGYSVVEMNTFIRNSGELFVDFNKALNNGTETAIDSTLVIADGYHPNELGNAKMFLRIMYDLPFLFDTRVVYNATKGWRLLNSLDVQQTVNSSTLPVSSAAVQESLKVLTKGDLVDTLTNGGYIQPNTGELLTSTEYHYSSFLRVTPGMKLLVSGTFSYNPTVPASNSGIAGYSNDTQASFVAPVFTLPMAGITTTGRTTITDFEVTVPAGVNYVRGSSVFATSTLKIVDATKASIQTVVPDLIKRVGTLENQVAIVENMDIAGDIEQGTINVDGTPSANTTRIRTNRTYESEFLNVTAINAGYNYIVWGWKADGTLVGHDGWQTKPRLFNLPELGYAYIKLAFKRTNDTAITPSDFASIGFEAVLTTTLKSLVLNGGGGTSTKSDVITRNFEAEKAVMAVRKQFDTQTTTNETDIFTIAHTSDLHGDVIRLKNFIEYSKYIGVDAATVTGDIVEQYFTDDFNYYVNQVSASPIPTFNTVGNHEAQNGGTDEQIEAKFFTPLVAQNGSVTSGKGYYYRDFATKKIRIIGINQFQQGGTVREKRYLKDDQITWLIATLKSTPANYGIIILTHIPEHEWSVVTGYEKFWQSQMFFTDLYTNITGSPIADLIDAFIGRTSINKSYTQSGALSTLTINTSFATGINTGVEFMAYLNGHLHVDRVGYLNNTAHKQLVLNIICGNAFVSQWRDGLGDLPRKAGTVVEDAFNVYGFDQTLGVVKIARVGSNVNYRMEKRDFMMIPYK